MCNINKSVWEDVFFIIPKIRSKKNNSIKKWTLIFSENHKIVEQLTGKWFQCPQKYNKKAIEKYFKIDNNSSSYILLRSRNKYKILKGLCTKFCLNLKKNLELISKPVLFESDNELFKWIIFDNDIFINFNFFSSPSQTADSEQKNYLKQIIKKIKKKKIFPSVVINISLKENFLISKSMQNFIINIKELNFNLNLRYYLILNDCDKCFEGIKCLFETIFNANKKKTSEEIIKLNENFIYNSSYFSVKNSESDFAEYLIFCLSKMRLKYLKSINNNCNQSDFKLLMIPKLLTERKEELNDFLNNFKDNLPIKWITFNF